MGFLDVFKKKEKKELTREEKFNNEVGNLIKELKCQEDTYEEDLALVQNKCGLSKKHCRTILARLYAELKRK